MHGMTSPLQHRWDLRSCHAGVQMDRNGPAHVLGVPLPHLPTISALHDLLRLIRPQPPRGQQPGPAPPLDRPSGPPAPAEASAEAPPASSAAGSPAQDKAGSSSAELSDSTAVEAGPHAAAAPSAPTASTQVSACSITSCELECSVLSLQL